jgi:hypothetical protein
VSAAGTSSLTPEERSRLMARVRAEYEAKRAEYEAKRARGETGAPSASETLAELERDQRTGRTVKHDWRCSPEEKARLYEAAAAAGLSSSEFLRTAVSKACDDVLTGERV